MSKLTAFLFLVLVLLLAACGGQPKLYSIGGSVTGLSGTLTLQNNGADDLVLAANGPFAFATKVADGGAYNVTIKQAPAGQNCTVTGGSGTVKGANVTSVSIACVAQTGFRSIGGSVLGLKGTLTLQNNGADDLVITADGPFTFRTKVADGGAYDVTIKQAPTTQNCTLAGGSGTVHGFDVDSVFVACSDKSWYLPTSFSDSLSSPGPALSPKVALNDAGEAVVVWDVFYSSASPGIYKAERQNGSWTGSSPLGSGAYVVERTLRLALNNAGEAVVVWYQSDGSGNLQIYEAERRNGSWAGPSSFSLADPPTPGTGIPQYLDVAINDSGDAVVVWGQDLQIFGAERQGADGGWTAPASLNPPGTDGFDPKVALNNAGDAVVVWTHVDGTSWQIYKAERQGADGSWSDPSPLSDANATATYAKVALNDAGDAVVIWVQYDGSNKQIYAAERQGGAWTPPVRLSLAGTDALTDGSRYYSQVALNDAGDAVVVWTQNDGSNYQIYKAERQGGAWTTPRDLADHLSLAGTDAQLPRVALNDAGDAVVVWQQRDGSNGQIYKAERRGGAWTTPRDLADHLSLAGTEAQQPQVALNDAGDAVVVWYQSDGSNDQIYKAEYR
ncbi:hypothetical protein [Oceanithermus sp.]|uniref:hypothetical protein n=1 Tax=Oceanithermus sp. TaxID=2268145 RepID=UPI00257ABD83|nr:hypothetical protein [Oceanithermus sp.]